MAILIYLDEVMAGRGINTTDLSEKVGITRANLTTIKSGRAKAVRFSTLDKLCETLNCQPGNLLKYISNDLLRSKRADCEYPRLLGEFSEDTSFTSEPCLLDNNSESLSSFSTAQLLSEVMKRTRFLESVE